MIQRIVFHVAHPAQVCFSQHQALSLLFATKFILKRGLTTNLMPWELRTRKVVLISLLWEASWLTVDYPKIDGCMELFTLAALMMWSTHSVLQIQSACELPHKIYRLVTAKYMLSYRHTHRRNSKLQYLCIQVMCSYYGKCRNRIDFVTSLDQVYAFLQL